MGRETAHDLVQRLRGQKRRKGRFPPLRSVQRGLRRVLADAAAARAGPRSPWIPAEFAAMADDWADVVVSYAVVDDQDDDTTVLAVADWPYVDYRSRLVFGETRDMDLETEPLWQFLIRFRCDVGPDGELRTPIFGERRTLRRRDIRVGDTFALSRAAVESLEAIARGEEPDLDAPSIVVLDVSADARDAAKIAFYAAATGTLDPTHEGDRGLVDTVWREQDAAETERRQDEQPGL